VSTSLVYRSAGGYELLMRALYGRHYADRLSAIAAQVPDGVTVLELCCGPGTLYRRHLHSRTHGYIGLDANERFVARLRRNGVDARQVDLAAGADTLPSADVAIMQASLYHFLPHPERVIDRMLGAAEDRVIISEPVRNLASSAVPIVRLLGRRAADPGVGAADRRFTERTLDELMERYRARIAQEFAIPGGREKVFVLRSSPQSPSGG